MNESDHTGMKEWMKANSEPISTIKKYIEKTVVNRAEWIRKTPDLSMREVMKEYPRLFDTPGMVLYICQTCQAICIFIIPNTLSSDILGRNRLSNIIPWCFREPLPAFDPTVSGEDYSVCRHASREVEVVLEYLFHRIWNLVTKV